MAILKQQQLKSRFTSISNQLLFDDNLNASAKVVMCALYSLPPNWNFSTRGLSKLLKMNKDTITAAIGKLEKAGYVKHRQRRTEDGRFGRIDIEIYYVPTHDAPAIEDEDLDFKPDSDNEIHVMFDENPADYAPCPKNSEPDNPCPKKPCPKKPDPENPPLLNTNLLDIKKSNTKKSKTLEKKEIYKEKKEPSQKGENLIKKRYAEFVTLTEDEYSSLIQQFGEEGTEKLIERLDDYKASTGKKYLSDYRTMLNWVKRDKERSNSNGFSRSLEREKFSSNNNITTKDNSSSNNNGTRTFSDWDKLGPFWEEAVRRKNEGTHLSPKDWSNKAVFYAARLVDWDSTDVIKEKIQFLSRISGNVKL